MSRHLHRGALVVLALASSALHAQPAVPTGPALELEEAETVGFPAVAPVRQGRLAFVLKGREGGADSTGGPATRFSRWFVGDVGGLVRGAELEPAVLGVAGGVALVSLADASLSRAAVARNVGPVVPFVRVVNEFGGPIGFGGAAAVWVGTLATDDGRLEDAAFTSVEAAVYANAITGVLKLAIGRVRPDAHTGPYDFRPFSGSSSFPSGHATQAFALVTPWAVYYPGPVTYGLFAVATGTAVARVALERHWPSDVVAGAAIGTAVGYALARRHLGRGEVVGAGGARQGPVLPVFHVAFHL
jgi:membrane-associated phospholipid phosphatase